MALVKEYEHIKCNCGGIIGLYNSKINVYTCDKCGRGYVLSDLDYACCMINDKTGWIFPMKEREVK